MGNTHAIMEGFHNPCGFDTYIYASKKYFICARIYITSTYNLPDIDISIKACTISRYRF